MTCGRCQSEAVAPEVCHWCLGPLCVSCWDAHGECGHPEAAEYREMAETSRRAGHLLPIHPAASRAGVQ